MILAFSPTFGLVTAIAAVLLYGLLALASKRLPAAAASAVLLAACFFQALTLAEGLFGDPPRFGFAPAPKACLETPRALALHRRFL